MVPTCSNFHFFLGIPLLSIATLLTFGRKAANLRLHHLTERMSIFLMPAINVGFSKSRGNLHSQTDLLFSWHIEIPSPFIKLLHFCCIPIPAMIFSWEVCKASRIWDCALHWRKGVLRSQSKAIRRRWSHAYNDTSVSSDEQRQPEIFIVRQLRKRKSVTRKIQKLMTIFLKIANSVFHSNHLASVLSQSLWDMQVVKSELWTDCIVILYLFFLFSRFRFENEDV